MLPYDFNFCSCQLNINPDLHEAQIEILIDYLKNGSSYKIVVHDMNVTLIKVYIFILNNFRMFNKYKVGLNFFFFTLSSAITFATSDFYLQPMK
jgi:hypothetical protein